MHGILYALKYPSCVLRPAAGWLGQRPTRHPAPWALAALLVGGLLVAACGGPASSSVSQAGVERADATAPRVALLAPLTGSAAAGGHEQLKFARLAVDDFNDKHGTRYGLLAGDTALDPGRAATLAQQLLGDQSVLAVVGPAGSQEVTAVARVTALADLATISPSATRADLTERGYRHFFRVVPRDDAQGAADARFIAETLGAQRVWVVDDRSTYSTGLANEVAHALRADGITVMRGWVTQRDTDFSALIARLKHDQPDVVFIPWQLASQGAAFARQLAEQGVRAKVVGGDGLFSAGDFIQAATATTEGAYASFFAPDITTLQTARPVVEAYRARYGDFGPFGAPAYAATTVALDAIHRSEVSGRLTRSAVLAEVVRTEQPTSILGAPIAFDAKGDLNQATFHLFQVRDGRFVPLPHNS